MSDRKLPSFVTDIDADATGDTAALNALLDEGLRAIDAGEVVSQGQSHRRIEALFDKHKAKARSKASTG